MGSPLLWLHLTLVTLKGQCQGLRFWKLISLKGAELGHMLLLNINRKAYKESPMTSSHLTLSDLKGLSQGHSGLKALYLVKEQS